MLTDYHVEVLHDDETEVATWSQMMVASAVEFIAKAINRFNENEIATAERYVGMAESDLIAADADGKWHDKIKAASGSFNALRDVADEIITDRGYKFELTQIKHMEH